MGLISHWSCFFLLDWQNTQHLVGKQEVALSSSFWKSVIARKRESGLVFLDSNLQVAVVAAFLLVHVLDWKLRSWYAGINHEGGRGMSQFGSG